MVKTSQVCLTNGKSYENLGIASKWECTSPSYANGGNRGSSKEWLCHCPFVYVSIFESILALLHCLAYT